MYSLEPERLRGLRTTGPWLAVAPNVVFLGMTSLLTDISSEMVTSVLPIYMAFSLGLTPLGIGLIDGIGQGAAALVRLASGLVADRWRRNREVAATGYALSALCKLGLLAVGSAGSALAVVIAVDRVGKGIRTSPRDALISLSGPPERLGLAFGVHRALDTAGALLGPLLAFALLALLRDAYDVIFVTSFFFALVGLAVIVLFVRNVSQAGPNAASESVRTAEALGLLRDPRFRSMLLAGSGLGLVTIADAFFYLTLQRQTAMPVSYFPLLYVATALGYLLLAIPTGRLGDRIGRGRVFLLGHALLLAACMCLLVAGSSAAFGTLALLLLGAYYACTDGVLMAAASTLVPRPLRASGIAVLTTSIGLTRLAASIVFGAAWNAFGLVVAISAFAAGLAMMTAVTAPTWLGLDEAMRP